MSWPTHGRDSHHETRVMRDDVMSYGDGDAVSGITLASFEAGAESGQISQKAGD